MDACRAAGKPRRAALAHSPRLCYQNPPVPRISTETLPRCRQCGAPLAGEKRRRRCPRCHPEEPGDARAQLDLFAPAVVVPEVVEFDPIDPDPPLPPEPAPIADAPFSPRPRRRAVSYLAIAAASLIVIGGLSWGGFQLWPRGPVERFIVQRLAELPHFIERTGAANPLAVVEVGADSSPAFADLNGDGALDLITGTRSGEIRVYLNVGTARQPRFLRPSEDTFGLVPTDTSGTIAFADLRGTHLPDAVNAGTNGSLTCFQNRGTREHAEFVLLAPEDDPFAPAVTPPQSFDWRPIFADIDGDGDPDLFIATRDGSTLFFQNHGTARQPRFQVVTRVNPFGLQGAGELLSLAFGDLDRDGDLDALAANAAGELRYFENRGTPQRPKFLLIPAGALGLTAASPDATVALVDLDADGDLDCITGGADGRLRYFENLSTPAR
jgi:hypothetical protein